MSLTDDYSEKIVGIENNSYVCKNNQSKKRKYLDSLAFLSSFIARNMSLSIFMLKEMEAWLSLCGMGSSSQCWFRRT